MVTRAYIDNLIPDATFFPPYDRADFEERLYNLLVQGLPRWDSRADTILRRSLPLISEAVATEINTHRAELLRGLLATAEGPDLDILGLGPPVVVRNLGESDENYRLRIANSWATNNLGSLVGIAARALLVITDAVTALPQVRVNRQDVDLFIAKSEGELLTTEEVILLTESLNDLSAKIAGTNTYIHHPNVIEYKIKVTLKYDATRYGSTLVHDNSVASLEKWAADNYAIGRILYKNDMLDAAKVPEARTWTAGAFQLKDKDDKYQDHDGDLPAGIVIGRRIPNIIVPEANLYKLDEIEVIVESL